MSHSISANHTGFCSTPDMMLRIANVTASYTDKSQELNIVLGQIIMFILAFLFMSHMFDFRTTLSPRFRLVLSSALALYLPVMSYLFSEAKDAAVRRGGNKKIEDPLLERTWVVLFNMLLVELLRRKVDEIRMPGYSEIIQRAGRFVWLGSLFFFNIKSIGRRISAGYLWIFCASNLVQRIVFAEVHKRARPDQSWLISSYMAQILHQAAGQEEAQQIIRGGDELLKRCKYIVMGEEKLAGEVTADGYRLINLNTDADPDIITVGKVWQLDQASLLFPLLDQVSTFPLHLDMDRIRRVCLSFALFKLLRPRFEHLPVMTKEEAMDCRDLFKKGLLCDNETGESAVLLFQVMVDEVTFLSEYYHSVLPVVLASPTFVCLNYLLQPAGLFSVGSFFLAFILYGHGDVISAWHRWIAETNPLGPRLLTCALVTSAHSRPTLFLIIDLSIDILFIIINSCQFLWELFAVSYSNWYMVSKICNDMRTKRRWYHVLSRTLSALPLLRLRSSNNIRLKQFYLLDHRGPPVLPMMPYVRSLKLTSVRMTDGMKQSIMELLVQQVAGPPDDDASLTNGTSALRRNNLFDQLRWACDKDSVTEVILTWHIATCLLESKLPAVGGMKEEAKVAMGLSKYCAYLVVFHPELLPDRVAKAELVVKDVRKELRGMLGFWGYYLSFRRARVNKILVNWRDNDGEGRQQAAADSRDRNSSKVVQHGAKLAMQLMEQAAASSSRGRQLVWKVLAEVWTELVVYVAPSSDEAHLKGHADILPEGAELITVLWVFAMHTGMSRPAASNTRPVQVGPGDRV